VYAHQPREDVDDAPRPNAARHVNTPKALPVLGPGHAVDLASADRQPPGGRPYAARRLPARDGQPPKRVMRSLRRCTTTRNTRLRRGRNPQWCPIIGPTGLGEIRVGSGESRAITPRKHWGDRTKPSVSRACRKLAEGRNSVMDFRVIGESLGCLGRNPPQAATPTFRL